jgi:hypothetical protein
VKNKARQPEKTSMPKVKLSNALKNPNTLRVITENIK